MPAKLPCELVTWNRFYRLCQLLAERIIQSDFRPEVIVAIGRGGYMPGRILSDFLGIMDLATFKIEHYRGPEKTSRAVIQYPLHADLAGKRVLLVDDVSDSGETFRVAIDHVRRCGSPSELRTAVMDHKTVCAYQPDFFARRVVKWRWITYPWAVTEDIKAFLDNMDPRPDSAEEAIECLYRDHGIRVSLNQLKTLLSFIESQNSANSDSRC